MNGPTVDSSLKDNQSLLTSSPAAASTQVPDVSVAAPRIHPSMDEALQKLAGVQDQLGFGGRSGALANMGFYVDPSAQISNYSDIVNLVNQYDQMMSQYPTSGSGQWDNPYYNMTGYQGQDLGSLSDPEHIALNYDLGLNPTWNMGMVDTTDESAMRKFIANNLQLQSLANYDGKDPAAAYQAWLDAQTKRASTLYDRFQFDDGSLTPDQLALKNNYTPLSTPIGGAKWMDPSAPGNGWLSASGPAPLGYYDARLGTPTSAQLLDPNFINKYEYGSPYTAGKYGAVSANPSNLQDTYDNYVYDQTHGGFPDLGIMGDIINGAMTFMAPEIMMPFNAAMSAIDGNPVGAITSMLAYPGMNLGGISIPSGPLSATGSLTKGLKDVFGNSFVGNMARSGITQGGLGAINSVANGGDPLTGLIRGGISGAAGSGISQGLTNFTDLGSKAANAISSAAVMGGNMLYNNSLQDAAMQAMMSQSIAGTPMRRPPPKPVYRPTQSSAASGGIGGVGLAGPGMRGIGI